MKSFFKKILYPPKVVLVLFPIISFSATIYVLARGYDKSVIACVVYAAAAYSLLILTLAVIKLCKKILGVLSPENGKAENSKAVKLIRKYRGDIKFKLKLSLIRGTTVDLIYALFRLITGIVFSSVWFITIAVYHALLCLSRLYLLLGYRKTAENSEKYDFRYENKRYKRSAVFLLFINAASGGMMYLTITSGRPFNYPYFLIYASALYAFIAVGSAIANLVRYSKTGSPIASAAKIIGLIAACWSLYGLQAALLNSFYTGSEGFDVLMNRISGAFIYLFTTGTAIFMLLRARKKDAEKTEKTEAAEETNEDKR